MEPLTTTEKILTRLNLGHPVSRFGVAFVLTNVAVWMIKPEYFFNPITKEARTDATIPWWSLGVLAGAIAALVL